MKCRELFDIEYPNENATCEEYCPGDDDRNYISMKADYCHCDEEDPRYHKCGLCWDQEVTNEEKLNDVAVVNLPYIKDSGERREFETGAVRDIQEGKGRCDLMPLDVIAEWFKQGNGNDPYPERNDRTYWTLRNIYEFKETGDVKYLYLALNNFVSIYDYTPTMFLEVSKHFEAGAVKYGENNWQKGIPVHCYIDSAVRHYLKFLRGDDDEPHDRAFAWNIMCCIWTCVHKPELNDFCEVKEAVEPKGYNPVERAYQMLVDIRDHSDDDDVHMSDIDDIIGYLGEALND